MPVGACQSSHSRGRATFPLELGQNVGDHSAVRWICREQVQQLQSEVHMGSDLEPVDGEAARVPLLLNSLQSPQRSAGVDLCVIASGAVSSYANVEQLERSTSDQLASAQAELGAANLAQGRAQLHSQRNSSNGRHTAADSSTGISSDLWRNSWNLQKKK